jgi:hypothetical protein
MAGLIQFTNNASTTLASSILVGDTSLTVATGTGGLFPTLAGSQYFYCTLSNVGGSVLEIVKVTARSTDTFTIVRAQDNTTASAFSAGDKVELRLVAADLNNFPQLDSTNTFAQAQTFTNGVVLGTDLPVSDGGTGASTADTARANLTAARSGSNTDITALSGLTTPLSAGQGGTGATSLVNAGIDLVTFATTATAAGTTTLTSTNPSVQFFTGTTTQTIVLPVASTMVLGQRFTLHNNSTGSLTVNSSGSNLVGTVQANMSVIITCISTSGTSAASWDFDVTGFSSTLPITRGGTGLSTIGSNGTVLTSDGTSASWVAAASGYAGISSAAYTTAGTYSWTVPTGITQVKVTVVGGGGGGGNAYGGQAYAGAAGGGSAGVNVFFVTGLTPGGTVSVTAGAGGGAGSAGGTSSFGAYGSATGGGAGGGNSGGGGAGGTGGGYGVTGSYGGSGSGSGTTPGGGAAILATNSTGGGTVYGLYFSSGGAAVNSPSGNNPGTKGGGGSGGAGLNFGGSGQGGAGGAGFVLIEY